MTHLDLFSGIGGFAYAVDQVWPGTEHIFCDNEPFAQEVLKKHWKGSPIYGDISELIDDLERGIIVVCNEDMTASVHGAENAKRNTGQDTASHATPNTQPNGGKPMPNTTGKDNESGTERRNGQSTTTMEASVSVAERRKKRSSLSTIPTAGGMKNADATTPKHGNSLSKMATPTTTKSSATTATMPNTTTGYAHIKELKIDLLTGGFPCQPFSAAGVRKGTSDNRYKWPEMLEVIRLTKPTWVIAENVGGILTWDEGVVFEQVCSDLESAGYEVQPLIIPAAAVGAPHRRDRVWFVAHRPGKQDNGKRRDSKLGRQPLGRAEQAPQQDNGQADNHGPVGQNSHATNTAKPGRGEGDGPRAGHGRRTAQERGQERRDSRDDRGASSQRFSWSDDWLEVATELCSVDDGLPVELDGLKLTKSKHRAEQLKAYGNAIVPQVAIEIMEGMKYAAAS